MKDCVFCRIIRGEEPSHQVWEDQDFLAFLSKQPLQSGHLLIVPKIHVAEIFQLPPKLYSGLFKVAKKIEPAVRRVTKAPRIGLAVEGFSVEHAHLHLVPVFGHGGLDSRLAHDVSAHELDTMAKQLRGVLI